MTRVLAPASWIIRCSQLNEGRLRGVSGEILRPNRIYLDTYDFFTTEKKSIIVVSINITQDKLAITLEIVELLL